MKRIYGISIGYWAVLLLLVGCGTFWLTVGRKTPKPSEDAVRCHLAARDMLRMERSKALDVLDSAASRKAKGDTAKHAVEMTTRAYNKMLDRLTRNESVFGGESKAIKAWVEKGRELNRKIPSTRSEIMNASMATMQELDRKWELFLEADVVDVLESK